MNRPNFWQGARVRLRSIEPGDAETFFSWNLDSEMSRAVDYIWRPTSLASARRWADRMATQEPEGDQFLWVIEDAQGTMVGIISTHQCDRRTGTFKYGIAIRAEFRRQGYASEAILLVLRYFFEELRYQKVTVHVYSFNTPSLQLHQRLGFQQEGRVRRMVYTQGQHFDEVLFGMTIEEFQALQGGT